MEDLGWCKVQKHGICLSFTREEMADMTVSDIFESTPLVASSARKTCGFVFPIRAELKQFNNMRKWRPASTGASKPSMQVCWLTTSSNATDNLRISPPLKVAPSDVLAFLGDPTWRSRTRTNPNDSKHPIDNSLRCAKGRSGHSKNTAKSKVSLTVKRSKNASCCCSQATRSDRTGAQWKGVPSFSCSIQ